MTSRLPLILSATALLVAVLGATPVGHAADSVVRAVVPFAQKAGSAKTAGFARYAGSASAVNGIKAARQPKPGQLVALGPDGKFPSSVGEAGPAGPPGATGAKGAAGPKGDAGTNGATKVTVVTATVTTAGNTNTTADCPAGTVATGGGWEGGTAIISRPVPRTYSSGETPTGWQAFLTFSASQQTIYVYAICASP